MIPQVISILFNLSLGFFTVASTILALYSINNRLRLRNVRLSWRSGKLRGFPLFASIFLFCTVLLTLFMIGSGHLARINTMLAYLCLSIMWFVSSYLASKHYISDHGIVKNINEPPQTIAWYQIMDFAEHQKKNGVAFTFVYKSGITETAFNRLAILVPEDKIRAFRKIVSLKLDHRLEGDVKAVSSPKEK